MNTSQLECCIDCDMLLKRYVAGVFPIDRLPNDFVKYPSGFIVNTDVHSKAGTHWLSLYIERNGRVEFFDSYGKPPSYYNNCLTEWINRHSLVIRNNHRRIQGDFSNVCGIYCLHYLHQRRAGRSMEEIVHHFSDTNYRENDQFIFEYFARAYPHCLTSECVYNQTCRSIIKLVP